MFIFHIFIFFLCCNDLEGVGTIPLPGGKDTELLKGRTEDEGFRAFHVDNEEEYVNIRIFVKTERKNELKDPSRLWIDGIVPFKISDSFGSKGKGTVYLAMRDIMMKTCIRFVPKKSYSNAFIFIEPGIGCRASIEKLLSGKISISRVCNSKGIIIHELMHVLGFHHEHNRPDRDEYVKIIWENIKEAAYHHFEKLSEDLVQTANFSYDYNSIMHYGSHRFSKNRGVPTIIPLKKNVTIGQRKGLSKSDILKIVKLYNCTMDVEKAREDSSKTTKLAKILGDTNSFWKVVYMTDNHKRFKRTTDNETSDANYYIGTGDSKADNTVADNTAYAESQDAYEDRLQQWRNQYLYWWNHYHGWANEHPISYKSLVSDWKGRRLRLATEFTPDAIATTKKMDPCENCTVTKLPKKTTIQATQITEQIEITTPAPMTTKLLKKITTIPPTTPCIPEELGIATSALTTTPCKISELTPYPQKPITTIPARVIREQQEKTTSKLTPSIPSVMTTKPPKTTTIPPPIITEQLEITTPAPTTVPCIPCHKPKMTTEPPKILTTVPASIITEEQGKITPSPGTTPCNRSEITTDSQEKITTVPAPIVREERRVATPLPTEPPSNPPIMTTKPPEKATIIPTPIVREERRVATPQPTVPPSNPPIMTTKPPKKVTTVPAPIVREERRVATPQPTVPPSNPPIRTTEAPKKVTTISPPIITEELGITTPAPATVPCTTCNKPEMTTGPPKQLTTVPARIIREKKDITTPGPMTIPCDKPDLEGKITTPCAMPEATAEVTTKSLVTDPVELIAECPKSENKTSCSKTPIPTTKSPKDEDVTGRSQKDYHLAWEPSLHPSPFHRIRMYLPIQGRTALKDPNRLWDNCKIPWELSDKYTDKQKDDIKNAMAEFERKTNVRFVEREDETQYIHIEPETKCSSVVGKSVRNVSQVLISEGCYELATILHELMHVLGFVHEQNRPDRDEYIRVVWDNIQEGAEKNFQKFSPDVVTTLDSEYDYNSLMHYEANAFARNSSQPTLVPLKANTTLGNREGFSEKDLIRINKLYNCSSTAELNDQSEEENDSDETDDSDNLSIEEDNAKTDIFNTTGKETTQTTSSFISCNNTEWCTLPPPATKDRQRDIMNVAPDPTPQPNSFEIQPFSEHSMPFSEIQPTTENSVPILNYLFSSDMVQKFLGGIDLLTRR